MNAADIARCLEDLGSTPLERVAVLAEAIAVHHGSTLRGSGIALVDSAPATTGGSLPFELTSELASPDVLGEVFETMLAGEARHKDGIHYTPRLVAEGLVAAATSDWPGSSAASMRILDPSVGGGAFLLAAARWRLSTSSLSRSEVCAELLGRDISAEALQLAEAALALWCIGGGESPGPVPGLEVGDVFHDDFPAADFIVGNPPFLSQLDASTAQTPALRQRVRERFAIALGPYADTASVFLLAGQAALAPGGRMVLIQPVSFLASRDVEAVRAALAATTGLFGLWFSAEPVFEASVQVCAPIIGDAAGARLHRWVGPSVAATGDAAVPAASSWGTAVADLVGVPVPEILVRAESPTTVGDLATATAGFRDQFYGFAPLAAESQEAKLTASAPPASPYVHLVTTGMVDPLRNRWGSTEFRFAKKKWTRPVVDLDALRAQDPTLAGWTQARLKPKILVATQTKVIEAVVDQHGTWIPVTPLLSIEPLDDGEEGDEGGEADDGLWRLAAVLNAPALSAIALAEQFGSALTVHAIKLAAKQLLALPLPKDEHAWTAGADAARRVASSTNAQEWRDGMEQVGTAMTAAYGSGSEVLTWWLSRLPQFDRR